jgi:hypothetical protein
MNKPLARLSVARLPEAAVRELAAAAASLVDDHDVIGTITDMLAGCTRCLGPAGAAGAGIVVTRPGDQQLEFLAATSHRAEDLELYQVQLAEGPAVDAIASNKPVTANQTAGSTTDGASDGAGDRASIAARWPSLVEAFRTRGFRAVYAHPLHWHGQSVGALNLFFGRTLHPEVTAVIGPVAQAFADIATLAIVHTGRVPTADLVTQLRTALRERVLVEQAKGVLAYNDQVDIDAAYARLLVLAAEQGRPLSQVAADVVATAVAPPTR